MHLIPELRLRLARVRRQMAARDLPAMLVTEDYDARYLTGRETGRVLISEGQAILWVKDIYLDLYRDLYDFRGYPLEVRVQEKNSLRDAIRSLRGKTVAVSSPNALAAVRKAARARVVVADCMTVVRSVKTPLELRLIKHSCQIAKAGMRRASDVIERGVRELDAVAEIEGEIRRRGSQKGVFGDGMLLASGARSADIHARPSLKRIGSGPVVVDLGANYEGYFSDMTRTFGVGRLTSEGRDVMSFVRNLRDDAIAMIRPGMLASEVHRFVDDAIKNKGYKFHHLSGHGVGLQIHESPSFGPGGKVRLKENMVFTMEPGVYLPGKFGVRFEDTVLLTKAGCKKLT
jgi:Xaa-Pro aminopeptidase